MKKPTTKNLTNYMEGRNLNVFQKVDAIIEYNNLLDYINKLEEGISVTLCCKELLFTTDEIVDRINEQTVLDGETFRNYFDKK